MGNKIDRAEQIWNLGIRDREEAITMILSGHCTHGSPSGALLHVGAFDAAAKDIIKYIELLDNDIPEPFKSLKEAAERPPEPSFKILNWKLGNEIKCSGGAGGTIGYAIKPERITNV